MLDRIYSALARTGEDGSLRGQLRVAAVKYKGRYKAHIREYYMNKHGELLPDSRGVTFSLEDAETILHALTLLVSEYREGLLEDDECQTAGS